MKIRSVYDSTIVYDTDAETINGSIIKTEWLSDGETLYEDTDSNLKSLSYHICGRDIIPYRIIETEDGNFYDMNGGRWDLLMRWTYPKKGERK